MADYKEIVGTRVKAVSANPSDPSDGQVWYNSTDEVLRYKKANGAGAWSSGGDLNNGRRLQAGSGTQTAALAFGGSGVPTAYRAYTETYNGSSWTEVGDLNSARDHTTGFGTQTASIMAGGYYSPPAGRKKTVESWDGSSWTEVGDLNEVKREIASCGISTAGLVFGGELPLYVSV